MDEIDVTVIGAGVVGLSVAAHAAQQGREVLLVERHRHFGEETSSRNSEVIHCGLYYRPGSLKARLCLEGNRLLYEICRAQGIPHRAIGKLIVATTEEETRGLESLLANGRANGVPGLELLDASAVAQQEPNVWARAALLCTTTGIVDSHRLMKHFEELAVSHGAITVYGAEVTGLRRGHGFFEVEATESAGSDPTRFRSRVVVNAAGLGAVRVAELAGVDVAAAGYRVHLVKGEYFRLPAHRQTSVRRLVYPFPPAPGYAGVHTVTDLQGALKLGPYNHAVERVDYAMGDEHKQAVYDKVRPFLPFVELDDLEPDMCGIQPKVQREGEGERDFVIAHETARGLPGLINLIGIESPGLTSSAAIGRHVAGMLAEALGET